MHQPSVFPVDGSLAMVSKLTHGNSIGDAPIVPWVINRGDMAQLCRQDAFVRGVELFDRPPSPCRVDFVFQWLPSRRRWLKTIRAPGEEGFHRIQRLTTKGPLTSAGGDRMAQLCGIDDQAGLFEELTRGGFAECFARIDPAAGSDPERRLGVTRVFDQKEQHAVSPVHDDDARRGPVERRGHLPIVTNGGFPCTAAVSDTLELRKLWACAASVVTGAHHTVIDHGVPGRPHSLPDCARDVPGRPGKRWSCGDR